MKKGKEVFFKCHRYVFFKCVQFKGLEWFAKKLNYFEDNLWQEANTKKTILGLSESHTVESHTVENYFYDMADKNVHTTGQQEMNFSITHTNAHRRRDRERMRENKREMHIQTQHNQQGICRKEIKKKNPPKITIRAQMLFYMLCNTCKKYLRF